MRAIACRGRGVFNPMSAHAKVENFIKNDKFLKGHEGTNLKEVVDVVCKAFKLG